MGPASSANRGVSLVEAIIATALMATIIALAAGWVITSAQAGHVVAAESVAVALASQKLEQLRALRFAVDEAGLPRDDLQSDTAVTPPAPTGGLGLTLSPPGTLTSDVPGYVDYVTRDGRVVPARAGALFVRRWAIAPLPQAPGEGLVIQACVLPVAAASRGGSLTGLGVVCLALVRTRGML
jgi:type II secretory pathway pseudopilin PulG